MWISDHARNRIRFGHQPEMNTATAAFMSPVTRKTSSMVRPAFSNPMAMPADATMKSALRMLFAAIIRERCEGSERSWISA